MVLQLEIGSMVLQILQNHGINDSLWCNDCKSQDSAGGISTGMLVRKRSENTDFQHENGPKNYTNSARGILGFTPYCVISCNNLAQMVL